MAAMLVLTAGSTALACDCITLSPSESFQEADVVFEGELIQIKPIPGNSIETTAYTFRVRRSLKGSLASEVTLIQLSTDCDAVFSPDTLYRVYARQSEGKLSSGSCFGNEVLAVRRVTRDSAQTNNSKIISLLPLATIGVVVTILFLLTRRRK